MDFDPVDQQPTHIALRRLIEGVKRNNLKASIIFIDFSKAFDSVHRGKSLRILKAYGIPEWFVQAISKLYEGTIANVLSPDEETEFFNILAGVLQGNTPAPYLFAIIIDYVMRSAINGMEVELGFQLHPRKSRRVPATYLTDLDFADDIALLSTELLEAYEFLHRVENEAVRIELHVNAKETEVMTYNLDRLNNQLKSRNDGAIKEVQNFKYLGGWLESSEKHIAYRKAPLAWPTCHKLRTGVVIHTFKHN